MGKRYELPKLPYDYGALEPYISAQIMQLHHDKHHLAYVNGANAALDKLEKARKGELQIDAKAVLRDYSFNFNGHVLHSTFWQCMAPSGKGGGGMPGKTLSGKIAEDFGSFDAFKAQFSDAAKSVEGSGWAMLAYEPETDSLVIAQVEKHNLGHLAALPVLMVLDVWEHAYYLQYMNDRGKFVENWWNVANWSFVESRLKAARR
jgi:Fe-Mn family superoxide dismutase